ncbi:MAG: monovalent cation/H+ antiporter subunit D family protein [Elusimicrobia bacterium]|nr:monovalent cation/H+ antiporter subunit D family protein [Elusimicrobiota bacterium]
MTEHFPALLVILPLLAAVLIPFSPAAVKRSAWHISFASAAASLALAARLAWETFALGKVSYWFGGWAPPWGIEYSIDPLGALLLLLTAFVTCAALSYSRAAAPAELAAERLPYFYSCMLLFTSGLTGIIITGDIFNLYVFIEIASLAGYALIAAGRRREALVASYNYLILGTIAATFILLGIGYLYMAAGTLNMADLRERLPQVYHTKTVLTGFAFLVVGLSIKTALFPLHIWLPDAYTHAPSPVSALLAATGTKVGIYAMIRVIFTVFKPEFNPSTVPMTVILAGLACAGIIYGALMALAQTNIKRLLAYSSVSQIGYIILGAAISNQTAMTGSLLHIINHALMKASLFMCAGIILMSTGAEKTGDLKGLGRRMPLTMAAFTAAACSLAGLPLTAGFISKWHLALGAVEAGLWLVVPVILAGSLLTAVYFWKIIEPAYFSPAGERRPVRPEAPAGMLAPAVLLAALGVALGLAAHFPALGAGRAAALLLGKP